MEEFIIYTEIRDHGKTERWYYGEYNYDTANKYACEMNGYGLKNTYYCVCSKQQAKMLKVENMPN